MPLDERGRPRVVINPGAAARVVADESPPARRLHRRLPGYAPTPLVDAPDLARWLGLGRVWVKDESSRLGVASFKMLGVSWATLLALEERLGAALSWDTIDELGQALEPLRPLTLTAASAGNHGHALAHLARMLKLGARIYVPAGDRSGRVAAIRREGADVIEVEGTYDDAVDRCAQEVDDTMLLISDTSWPGYEQIPRRVADGYSTIFSEIDDQLAALQAPDPDIVVAPLGVGSLGSAIVSHYRANARRAAIVGVEPADAACVLESVRAGRLVEAPGPHRSVMAGLNTGRASPAAWPLVRQGIDVFVAVDDRYVTSSLSHLRAAGVNAGNTGAAGPSGLRHLWSSDEAGDARELVGYTQQATALVVVTEGPVAS